MKMKDLHYYLNLSYKMEVIRDEDAYVVRFPELPGCLTSGKTKKEALKNAEDAKRCWFTAALEDCPGKIKEPANCLV